MKANAHLVRRTPDPLRQDELEELRSRGIDPATAMGSAGPVIRSQLSCNRKRAAGAPTKPQPSYLETLAGVNDRLREPSSATPAAVTDAAKTVASLKRQGIPVPIALAQLASSAPMPAMPQPAAGTGRTPGSLAEAATALGLDPSASLAAVINAICSLDASGTDRDAQATRKGVMSAVYSARGATRTTRGRG